jgi:hypothetical protein
VKIRIEMDVVETGVDALMVNDISGAVEDATRWVPGVSNVTVTALQTEEAIVSD